jgi:hypothetical protein
VQIAEHYKDMESSLRLYFSTESPRFTVRFAWKSIAEVVEELEDRLDHADKRFCLAVLTSLEAAFYVDYFQRCQKRDREPVSRARREIYREKHSPASLEDDIFGTWLNHGIPRSIIDEWATDSP